MAAKCALTYKCIGYHTYTSSTMHAHPCPATKVQGQRQGTANYGRSICGFMTVPATCQDQQSQWRSSRGREGGLGRPVVPRKTTKDMLNDCTEDDLRPASLLPHAYQAPAPVALRSRPHPGYGVTLARVLGVTGASSALSLLPKR